MSLPQKDLTHQEQQLDSPRLPVEGCSSAAEGLRCSEEEANSALQSCLAGAVGGQVGGQLGRQVGGRAAWMA